MVMHGLTAFKISSIAIAALVAAFGCLGSRPEGKKASGVNQNDASTTSGGAGSGVSSEAGASDSGTGGQGGTSAGGASGAGASSGGAGGAPLCEPGTDCSTKCQEKKIACTTGTPECKFVKNVADGTDCGGGQICNAGNCNLCVKDQPCVPAADPCHKGTTSCDPVGCNTTTAMQDDGTPCDDHDRCTSDSSPDAVNPDKCQSGVCTGAPVVCQAQATCHRAGTCDSTTGCSDPLQPNGTACGTNGICDLGVCVCSSPDIMCPTNRCVNPVTDRKNCGDCDRDCQSGLCSSRVCQPWVVLPKSDLGGVPPCFATDGKDLVWFAPDSGGKLRKVTATGSALTTTLVVQGETPGRLALVDSTVVWTTTSPTTRLVSLWTNSVAAPVSGVAVPIKTLGTPGHSYEPVGLAVDGTADHAYFELVEDGTSATIQDCTLTADAICRSLGSADPSTGGDVVLGQGYVFWTEAAKGRVVRYSLSDGTTTDVVTGQVGPYLLAADTAYVYWADRFSGSFTIKRASQDNPDPSAPETVLTASVPGALTALATDGMNVYYAGMFGRNDKVGYVLASGGSGQPFFQDGGLTEVPPGLLALAKGAVYYYSPGDMNIQGLVTVR